MTMHRDIHSNLKPTTVKRDVSPEIDLDSPRVHNAVKAPRPVNRLDLLSAAPHAACFGLE